MSRVFFITGATGNLGSRLAAEILNQNQEDKIVALVRGASYQKARDRMYAAISRMTPEINTGSLARRLLVIGGDITDPRLGIGDKLCDCLAGFVTHIVHAAASTKFNSSLENSRHINLEGTRNVMAFAERASRKGNLRRIAYISTAYVCGMNREKVYEEDPPATANFANAYEQSKFESESYVRRQMASLPLAVMRPSIIVGDSATGRIASFNVLYVPLGLILSGLIKALPCPPENKLDVIPVDYAARVVLEILGKAREYEGRTYHLTAGPEISCTIGEIVATAAHLMADLRGASTLTQLRFSYPDFAGTAGALFNNSRRAAMKILRLYEPYLLYPKSFDTTNTERVLAGTGINVPRLTSYLPVILAYGLRNEWGRQWLKAA